MAEDRQKSLTGYGKAKHPVNVPGRPFRSLLTPHFLWIKARRRAGATWKEIAEALGREKGVQIGEAAVYRYFDRTARRTQWPAGLEPDNTVQPPSSLAPPVSNQERPKSGLFGPARGRGKSTPSVAEEVMAKPTLKPRPYRSQMLPHLAFIEEQRRAGESWRQIAQALATRKGVKVSYQAVAEFYSRTKARAQKVAAKAGTATEPPAASSLSDDDPVKEYLS